MKIITLVPVKNEAWILRFSLKNFCSFSDEVIILDDGSEDESKEIMYEYKNVKIVPFKKKEAFVDMSLRRNILLEEGRKSGGTHFIFLDADEIFSENFTLNIRTHLQLMKKGEVLG
jgi:glycosyltransferase involved in cell wall biosynthesis